MKVRQVEDIYLNTPPWLKVLRLACTVSAAPLGVAVLTIWRGEEEGVEGISYMHAFVAMVLGMLMRALLSKVWTRLKTLGRKS